MTSARRTVNPRIIAAIIAAVALVAVAVLVAVMTVRSNRDAELTASEQFAAEADTAVVDYYARLCNALVPVLGAPSLYANTASQVIGKTDEERNEAYGRSARTVSDTLITAVEELNDLDTGAPESIKSAPDDPRGVSYAGAVMPLVHALTPISDEIHGLSNDPRFGGGDEAEGRAVINEFSDKAGQITTAVSETMPDVLVNLPIYSPATTESVRTATQCAPLLGSSTEVDETVAVSSVVDAVSRLGTAEGIYQDALAEVADTHYAENPSTSDVAATAEQTWRSFSEKMTNAERTLREWNNTEVPGTPEYAAGELAHEPLNRLATSYRDAAIWANGAADRIRLADGAGEMTQEMSSIDGDYMDTQKTVVRDQLSARGAIPLINEATAEATRVG